MKTKKLTTKARVARDTQRNQVSKKQTKEIYNTGYCLHQRTALLGTCTRRALTDMALQVWGLRHLVSHLSRTRAGAKPMVLGLLFWQILLLLHSQALVLRPPHNLHNLVKPF